MEFRHLRAFLAIAEEASFTRAAARLYLTQSALSQQIRDLERGIGAPLFHRSAHWVRLTPTGEALLEPASRTVDAAAEALAIARQHARSDNGQLKVGLFYGGAAELTRPILATYRKRFPNLQVQVSRPDHRTMHTAVADGDLDLAFVRSPVVSPRLTVTDLFEEPRLLAVSAHHPLADAGDISVHDVLDLPLVNVPPWVPHPWWQFWSLAAHRNGSTAPLSDIPVANVLQALHTVTTGHAVMPTAAVLARAPGTPEIHFIRLTHTPGSRVSLTTRHDDRRLAVIAFIETAHLVTSKLHNLIDGATYCPPE
jgi:DNA-binding transcriptional LysR family regulator